MAAPTPQSINTPAPHTPYFTPLQPHPTGTSLASPSSTPKLFTPITLRGSTLPNRLWLAPMCLYSADAGHPTDFHLQHLGSIAVRGAGLIMIEATAVLPSGRISQHDVGVWSDAHIPSLRRIADFIHSQSKHFSVQLAHSGRKGSTVAPWLAPRGKSILAGEGIGGWPKEVVGPSPVAWDENHALPKELSVDGIKGVVKAFADAARRCVQAGVDSVQIHAAHGYLIHEFLSGVSNTRTDTYGGSFENRIRLLLEVVDAVRTAIPDTMPLMVRFSATDWLHPSVYPGAWTVADTIRAAKAVAAHGVDLVDISSGGNHPAQQIDPHNAYQVTIAAEVKKALVADGIGMLVSGVGGIGDGVWANKVLEELGVDVVFAGRAFLRDAGFALRCAQDLGVEVQGALQYGRMGRREVRTEAAKVPENA